jgi:hypothetical protein
MIKVLKLLRQDKNITEIASLTGRHPNTVSKYVEYIRVNYIRDPQEIVNKIDDKLNEELEGMTNYELIAYRKAITPQKIESKELVKIDERKTVEITATLQTYEDAVRRAIRENMEALQTNDT